MLVGRFARPVFPFHLVPTHACGNDDVFGQLQPQDNIIPNIVHYVWLLKDPTELHLDFKVFVSVYSAYIFWKPESIYFHTDATPEIYAKAKDSGSIWTRRVLAIPGVNAYYVEAPTSTTKGVEIKLTEHKTDFLRIIALQKFGGVYLDTDAVPLRSIDDLRNTGFANIVGGETVLNMRFSGYLNNGVMMARPHSTLMRLFYHAAHEFYDGGWATASIHLLTDISYRLARVPFEVLILQSQAFAPTSWELNDMRRLFLPKLQTPTSYNAAEANPSLLTCDDALSWLAQRNQKGDAWELDFSSSYILHAFDNGMEKIWGWDHQINLKYVLARQSNYARAVFPAVWHAVEAGIIPEEETR
ncbi:hypothetical protein GQ53DRAFT_640225 [Thozetella sp. PMI_491]|nr:hypothetical protein GQ53DRAFT_640225 [Thozetella sp. PMI_491]